MNWGSKRLSCLCSETLAEVASCSFPFRTFCVSNPCHLFHLSISMERRQEAPQGHREAQGPVLSVRWGEVAWSQRWHSLILFVKKSNDNLQDTLWASSSRFDSQNLEVTVSSRLVAHEIKGITPFPLKYCGYHSLCVTELLMWVWGSEHRSSWVYIKRLIDWWFSSALRTHF